MTAFTKQIFPKIRPRSFMILAARLLHDCCAQLKAKSQIVMQIVTSQNMFDWKNHDHFFQMKNCFFFDFFFFRRPQCRCCVMDAMWWVLKSPHHNRSNEESIKGKASPRYQVWIARVTQRTLCAASEIPFHFFAPNPRLIVQNINPRTGCGNILRDPAKYFRFCQRSI